MRARCGRNMCARCGWASDIYVLVKYNIGEAIFPASMRGKLYELDVDAKPELETGTTHDIDAMAMPEL